MLPRTVLVYCLILLGVFSCEEGNPPTLGLSCTPEEATTEEAVTARLLGEWEWKA